MFLTRSRILRFFIRHSRDLNQKPPLQAADSQPANKGGSTDFEVNKAQACNIQKVDFNSFPYKFGGVKNYGTSQSIIELFFKEEKIDFFKTYLTLLESIANKNESKLAEMVELSLLKSLLQPQLMSTVINPNSEGQILFHDMSIGVGVKFVRGGMQPYTKQSTPDNVMHMYSPTNILNTVSIMKMGGNIPMLISINTTIKSKTKLGLQGYKGDQDEQAHSLSFQCESALNPMNMMGIMQSLPTLKSAPPDPSLLRKLLFNEDKPRWRIGNIDGFLKLRYQ